MPSNLNILDVKIKQVKIVKVSMQNKKLFSLKFLVIIKVFIKQIWPSANDKAPKTKEFGIDETKITSPIISRNSPNIIFFEKEEVDLDFFILKIPHSRKHKLVINLKQGWIREQSLRKIIVGYKNININIKKNFSINTPNN